MAKQKESAVVEEIDLIEKITELEARCTFMTELIDNLESSIKKLQEFKQPTGVAGLDMQVQFEKCLETAMLVHLRVSPNMMKKASENANYVRSNVKSIIDFASIMHEEICKSFASKKPA
jgi:hypothetical protein